MLAFAALMPNSPLLFQSLNPTRIQEAEVSIEGLKELSEELYASRPDTIIILAESATMYPDAFSLNVADPYASDLSELGDLGYHKNYHPDFGLVDAIQRFTRKEGLPVSLSTDDRLNFATTVPLHYLTEHLPNVKIVPIAPTSLDLKSHFAFGTSLKHLIADSHKRIAVIAAGDTSHVLSKEGAGGYHTDGEVFDEKIQSIIKERNASGLIQLDPDLVERAKDTCHRQLAMLFGVLDGVGATPHILSYEKPFGTGYLVANFVL